MLGERKRGSKNWRKVLDLTSRLCYSLRYDKSNTHINDSKSGNSSDRIGSGFVSVFVGEKIERFFKEYSKRGGK